MSDWRYARAEPSDRLARLHLFSIVKHEPRGEVEFQISVREFAQADSEATAFFAEADKQTNQNSAPFTPSGWGSTLVIALEQCIRAIHRFPYEGPLPD
jgi:hypothetical protein